MSTGMIPLTRRLLRNSTFFRKLSYFAPRRSFSNVVLHAASVEIRTDRILLWIPGNLFHSSSPNSVPLEMISIRRFGQRSSSINSRTFREDLLLNSSPEALISIARKFGSNSGRFSSTARIFSIVVEAFSAINSLRHDGQDRLHDLSK